MLKSIIITCSNKLFTYLWTSRISLLAKLDSVRSSQERGSEVSSQSKALFHKFVEQVDQIFQNLPKSLEWRSFYTHDLTLLVDICKEVQNISIQHNLNKSQTRALAKLNGMGVGPRYPSDIYGLTSQT